MKENSHLMKEEKLYINIKRRKSLKSFSFLHHLHSHVHEEKLVLGEKVERDDESCKLS